MPDTSLQGRAAIVTGGAGGDAGLGLTTTEALLRAGARVAVWDRSPEAAARARHELARQGFEPLFQEVDVTDQAAIERAYQQVRDSLGPVDVLVNNAAVKMDFMLGPKSARPAGTLPFWQLDPARFLRLLEINVYGPFLTSRLVVPDMAAGGRGSVINVVTSPHTQRSPKHIPYGPSKAALQAMTQAMAAQLEGTGVRVNAVLPGGSANRRGESDPSLSAYDCMVSPILWLASDQSATVTGQVFTGEGFVRP